MNPKNEATRTAQGVESGERVRLSQWDAIVLESVRALGLNGEELLNRAASGDLPSAEGSVVTDFGPLATLQQEQPEVLKQAVDQGYRIKYNTLGGIHTWIRIVFGRESEVERGEGIEGVSVELTAEERDRIAPVLSIGWTIRKQEGDASEAGTALYRIVPMRS
ncbi:hypothetical protein CDO73_10110 [Saccharibacillus sp. O23]|uniref:hypothetical protein n=1 Tax=Saccharibacillus sp. O23 TaxID=2009338 RepID=UPI000B4E557E|nr:hypothetical protein [Saccharibacillus sp. O23]OWR30929.1 hypothetical protein CDO73_10110 [Saccharibacillus sp. O23]